MFGIMPSPHRLREDEVVCPKCSGCGLVKHSQHMTIQCKVCNGYGMLDWCRRIIVGRQYSEK